jgi:metal-responsive CopG/Arc/MetJ family transcriptional regulator
MRMETIRLNITIPKDLARELSKRAGTRKKSRFIAEAIRQKIDDLNSRELKELLKEGYASTRKESLDLTGEFEPVDLEGWDEY